MVNKLVAEFVGTFVLVFFGVGSAVFGLKSVGPVGVALAFGLVLLALVYAIGPISGCHANPAVTIGMWAAKKINARDAIGYIIAQIAGAILAASLLKLLVAAGKASDETGALGSNGFGKAINVGGAFLVEAILTFLLVLVVLLTTCRAAVAGFAGIAIGFTLAVIHLVGIPWPAPREPGPVHRPGLVRRR